MENDVRIINMRNVAAYMKKNILFIIVAVIIGGALLGGYNYKKQKDEVDNHTEEYVNLLKMTMTQNHDAYYFKKTSYSDAQPYKGIYNSAAKIYVDFNYSDVEGYEMANFDKVNEKFCNDALLTVWDYDMLEEIIDELQLRSYDDMKNIDAEKLQWLINKNFLGAHIMNIVVSDVNAERAKAICDKIVEKFVANSKKILPIDSVKIINTASLSSDNSSFGKTASNVKVITEIEKKTVLKYGIAGAFIGFVLIFVFFLAIYIIRDVVRCDTDIKAIGLASVLGSYDRKVDHKRVAGCLDIFDDVNNILVVGIDNKVDIENFAKETQKELKENGSSIKLSFAADYRNDVSALKMVKESDAVVYLIKRNKTKLSDIIEAKTVLERANIKCLGGIIV